MKTLLAILLSFVISEAPVLAIHGGYTIGGTQSVIGTYAGVLVPVSDNLLVPSATSFGKNSLALFTLSIPTQGLGTGTVVVFANGSSYTGSIQALPDPNSDTGIVGVLNASFNYTLSIVVSGTVQTEAITSSAQGSFDANTVQNANSSGGLGVDLTGTSSVDITNGNVDAEDKFIVDEQVVYEIEGFQSSTSATTQ